MMLLCFFLTAAAALGVAYLDMAPTVLMGAPFALLVLSLTASVLTHARFRADLPLLLFHLALVVLVGLIGMARLVYREATTTLSSGTAFEGHLITDVRGPLHAGRLVEVQFANDGFSENFARRNTLHATYNLVRWRDDAGQWHAAQIGDDHPLLIKGYKIFTSHHRGFSPLFRWQSENGIDELGAVQLTDQLGGNYMPASTATLPNGSAAWVSLDFMEPEAKGDKVRISPGGKPLDHRLILRLGDERHVLRVGEQIALPGGRLTYVRLDSWMGYSISYDPTRPWVVATVLIGIFSLIWFYWRRLWRSGSGRVAEGSE